MAHFAVPHTVQSCENVFIQKQHRASTDAGPPHTCTWNPLQHFTSGFWSKHWRMRTQAPRHPGRGRNPAL